MSNLRILFYGTPDFAARGLRRLLSAPAFEVCAVVTQPDKPAGRGALLQASPVKELALTRSIPVLQPTSIRAQAPQFCEALKRFLPLDAAVVIAFGQILPPAVLEIPRAGSFNVHASLLPRWRGAAPIQRAIIAGDRETGVCLMKMEAGLDCGPVYARTVVQIRDEDTFATLHDRLAEAGGQLLVERLSDIVAGRITPQTQPNEGVTYAGKIGNEESLIDWRKAAIEIARLVRGLSPAPGAYTTAGGRRLKIVGASAGESSAAPGGQPGEILAAGDAFIEVQCGAGSLSISEVQIEGKKRMAVADFLRGNPLPPHSRLGA